HSGNPPGLLFASLLGLRMYGNRRVARAGPSPHAPWVSFPCGKPDNSTGRSVGASRTGPSLPDTYPFHPAVAIHRRGILSPAPSRLDDAHDLLQLFPDRAAQLVAGLLHLGTELLADVRELGLLVVGQVQVLEVGGHVGHPVTDVLPALVLQVLQL